MPAAGGRREAALFQSKRYFPLQGVSLRPFEPFFAAEREIPPAFAVTAGSTSATSIAIHFKPWRTLFAACSRTFSGILIAALSIPGDCRAQQPAQPQKAAAEPAQKQVLVLPVRSEQPGTPTPASQKDSPQLLVHAQQPSGQQNPPPPAQSGMSSGIAGGVGAAPVYDELKRPITAGGFVDKGPVVFEDVTKAAGLSGWSHKMGVPQKQFIVETNGSGVALIDYDNSGWLSIYLVNGSTFDALDGKEEPPHAALFRNNQ